MERARRFGAARNGNWCRGMRANIARGGEETAVREPCWLSLTAVKGSKTTGGRRACCGLVLGEVEWAGGRVERCARRAWVVSWERDRRRLFSLYICGTKSAGDSSSNHWRTHWHWQILLLSASRHPCATSTRLGPCSPLLCPKSLSVAQLVKGQCASAAPAMSRTIRLAPRSSPVSRERASRAEPASWSSPGRLCSLTLRNDSKRRLARPTRLFALLQGLPRGSRVRISN